MNERERLIEILKCVPRNTRAFYGQYADYLLENGVVVPICKIGDTVYVIWFSDDSQSYKMAEHTVTDISTKYIWLEEEELYYPLTAIGEEVFLSEEEAEQALRKENEGK